MAPNLKKVRLTLEECQSRMPVIGVAETPEEALEELQAGAHLIETKMRPFSLAILLKQLKKQAQNQI